MKKLLPDMDGPKYGIPFKVIGFQALTEKGKYTELIKITGEELKFKCRRDYRKWKEEMSEKICNSFNIMLETKWEKIVSFKVKYLCETEDHYI